MRASIVNQNVLIFPRRKVSGYQATCPDCQRHHTRPWRTATQRGPRLTLCVDCFIGLKR